MATQWPDPIKVVTRRVGDVRLHTFIAAYTDNHIADATHIIESANRLVLIDGQFYKYYAKEFRVYANSLKKPVERLYLTHRHPDHWFGLEAFSDVPIFALPETIESLKTHGQELIKSHQSKLWDQAPTRVVIPGNEIHIPTVGTNTADTIDSVNYRFSKVVDTEIDFHLIIELPDLNVCILQDLIYSGTHLYLTEYADLGNWIRFLEEMLLSDYDLFLAGHGYPANKKEVAENIEYLWAARGALAQGLKGEDFKSFLVQRYPDRLCLEIFNIYLPRLFEGTSQYGSKS